MAETMDEIIERFERELGDGHGPITVKIGRGLYHEMRRRGVIVDRQFPNPAFPDDPWVLPGYAKSEGVFTPPDSSAPDWDYVMGDGGLSSRG